MLERELHQETRGYPDSRPPSASGSTLGTYVPSLSLFLLCKVRLDWMVFKGLSSGSRILFKMSSG